MLLARRLGMSQVFDCFGMHAMERDIGDCACACGLLRVALQCSLDPRTCYGLERRWIANNAIHRPDTGTPLPK